MCFGSLAVEEFVRTIFCTSFYVLSHERMWEGSIDETADMRACFHQLPLCVAACMLLLVYATGAQVCVYLL